MTYHATKAKVSNRGVPPDSFLDVLVAFGRTAPDEIFTVNSRNDIYSSVRNELGPWSSLQHRKAAMLEVLRCLSAFESSWNWNEGRDTSNPNHDTPENEETGAFQVSFDALPLSKDGSLAACVFRHLQTLDVHAFITGMKSDHLLAVEFCGRLLRWSITHHGPVLHHSIHPWLSRSAVDEFQMLIAV